MTIIMRKLKGVLKFGVAAWENMIYSLLGENEKVQAGRRLVRSLLTLSVFVVDVMDLRTGNRNEDDS